MSLFLFKPHIENLVGNVTSPDVVVDRVFVGTTEKPINRLTSDIAQSVEREDTARAAYALSAVGGGLLISPAILLSSGTTVIARRAWRWKHLEDHAGNVTLNGATLDDLGPPERLIRDLGGSGGLLPRGYMVIQPGSEGDIATLHDGVLDRQLTHRVILQPVGSDHWRDERPLPRYSIGPTQKEIRHYI